MGKARGVAAVEADIDAADAGIDQRRGMIGEAGAVGGQREFVQPIAQMPPDPPHQIANVAAHERFAPGQADAGDAARDEQVGEQRDFFEGQHLILGEELHLFRHAIAAAQVAAIRHRNAQIADPATKAVGQRRAREGSRKHGG